MRVLIAPDKFAGTLTAVEAAEAMAAGWRRRSPGDQLDLAPMSDGGPGFVGVLHTALGGDLEVVTVPGPHGEPTPATLLLVGETAYVESAQACGLQLTGGDGVEVASTVGVGRLVEVAVDAGAGTVVVGLGGSGSCTPSGRRRTVASTPDRCGSPTSPASTWPPRGSGSPASGWSPRATWTYH
jgi:glycerate 2-kinase